MPTYKVSIVVPNRRDLGGVQTLEQEPKPGDTIVLATHKYQIIELMELMPPRREAVYLHAVCRLLNEESYEESYEED